MRPVDNLAWLSRSCDKRLGQLHTLVLTTPVNPSRTDDRAIAHVTVEAMNLWVSFVRAFYLSCMFRARRSSGRRVSHAQPSNITMGQAIALAVQATKPTFARRKPPPYSRRDEPTWYDPTNITIIAPAVGLSNVGTIQGAFGYGSPVFAELPTIRNFYAHRNDDTARKVRSGVLRNYRAFGYAETMRPTVFLCSRLPGRPQSILADWLSDIRAVVSHMSQ